MYLTILCLYRMVHQTHLATSYSPTTKAELRDSKTEKVRFDDISLQISGSKWPKEPRVCFYTVWHVCESTVFAKVSRPITSKLISCQDSSAPQRTLDSRFASRTQRIRRRQSRTRRRTQRRKRARRVQITPHIPQHVDSPPALRRLHFDALEQRLDRVESEIRVLAVAERRRLL